MVRFSMLVTILGALTGIAMNFMLIPRFGGLGAAWAVVISQAVSSYLSRSCLGDSGRCSASKVFHCGCLSGFSLKRSLNELSNRHHYKELLTRRDATTR